MRIVSGFNEKIVEGIARQSGSKSVKSSIAYLRRANYYNPEKFACEVIDDVAFFAGDICKTHFRLLEIAVVEEYQRKHYGSLCMFRIKAICKANNLTKITLRVAKDNDKALAFYKKYGLKVVGDKGEDWEAEIPV